MIPLIVVRPEPGCDATVRAAQGMGLEAFGFPLFSVRALAWQPPDPAGFDALLIGSANAIRLGGEGLAGLRGLPVLAVGEATAREARQAGFTVADTGAGGLQPLLERVGARYPRLLRLSGRERVPLAPAPGTAISERTVYASEPLDMTSGLRSALGQPCVVALHSAGAAHHFAALCDGRAIDRTRIALAALGDRIAVAAGSGWADVRTAERPDDAALLAIAAAMCHTAPGTQASGQDNRTRQGAALNATQDELRPLTPDAGSSRRSWRTVLIVGLLAFAVGVALTGWFVADGRLKIDLPGRTATPSARLAGQPVPADSAAPLDSSAQNAQRASAMVGGVETRLALLEERMARLDMEANAASGHAARAEGLLIAFAARRVIARGGDLGFIEDQLRLRFGGAQPEAVRTVIDFARDPLTLDELSGALDNLAPGLADAPQADRGWGWIMNELSGLFVVRSGTAPSPTPADHVRRARMQLASGQVAEAIAEVEKMPGAESAALWIEGARRYDRAQAALDVIETAAMLEPRRLRDAAAREIDEPSPLAQPALPAPSASSTPAPAAALR